MTNQSIPTQVQLPGAAMMINNLPLHA